MGNLFLSVAAHGDSKGADSAFLEYQNRLGENATRQRALTNIMQELNETINQQEAHVKC